jgi:hypothetical protein
MILSSSGVEQVAVNHRVGSSNLSWGATLLTKIIKKIPLRISARGDFFLFFGTVFGTGEKKWHLS